MQEKTDLEILTDARALVAKGWTKGSYAKTASGKDISWANPKACRFCASGAIFRASGINSFPLPPIACGKIIALLDEHPLVAKGDFNRDVVEFNDDISTSKKQVLQVFDDVIAGLRS